MVAYKYKGITKGGKTVTGIIEAYDEFDAVDRIKETCNVVLEVKEASTKKNNVLEKLNEPMKLSEKMLSLTASQFAILLKSGLPTSRTVQAISEQSNDKYMKKVLTQVADDVYAGFGLADSLELRGPKIPDTFIEMVRAGEESGTLETSFDKIAKYYEKSARLNGKVKGAMVYPAFLAVLAVIVITIVIRVAVPTIASTISSSGGEIPGITQFLLNIYDFFSKYGIVVIALILAIIMGIKVYQTTENGKLALAKNAFKMPLIGKIVKMSSASQFASTVTTLLSAGLPLSRCLVITGKVMSNYAAGKTVATAAAGIDEGRRLGDVLKGNEYLPELLVEMAAVGEESGALEETLTTIGEYFDAETEQASAKALSALEPAITVVMGIVIGFIVIALYLPMFTMYNGM